MTITKEYLEDKKKELETGMIQAVANYNANKGAVQFIDMLLYDMDNAPVEDKAD